MSLLKALWVGALVATACVGSVHAQTMPTHGFSIFGDLKYQPDFAHFDYVNPDAPKGGTLSHIGPNVQFNQSFLSFDTLNSYILKGAAAQGMELTFDTLLSRAHDEPDAAYGLIARSISLSDDRKTLKFELRPQARFHDGTALTAEDVAFSLTLLQKEGHPLITGTLREVTSITAPDPATVMIEFSGNQAQNLPLFIGSLPIFSKAYYTTHDFTLGTLEPPLGSGPYKVGKFKAGAFITYDRVADYWAKDLPVNVGRWNFDAIRYEFYRDRTTQFEAFKKGAYLLREEFTSKVWATEYNFPAVEEGRVVKLTLPDDSPSGAQGWFINTRREKFQDPRVREALSYAFDFEWTNKNQFHGLYKRTHSFFENSDLKATGLPDADELALLEPYRAQLPDAVFGTPIVPPVSDGSNRDRTMRSKATHLLAQAGWHVKDGVLQNDTGETLQIEFLTDAPTFERIIAPYVANLEKLGIDASLRIVDSAQYQERMKSFDFDLTTMRYSFSATPGAEVEGYMHSRTAFEDGSRNLSGINSPVVDGLLNTMTKAGSRAELRTAARALDRVLRAGHYWVPQWYKASHGIAYWDVYERPVQKPRYQRGIIDTWWVDADKAAQIGKGQ
ncbi:MAG: extracellular solute-binding protein [Parvibaculaceae bacterium]|nr:extracellular solute-binding protein [Parvibaculaceae bacterium]